MSAVRAALPPFLTAKVLGLAFALLAAPSLISAFVHWDSPHYLAIASNGYPRQLDFHDAFLPGYPLLIWVARSAIHDPIWAGLLVSALGQFLALYWISRWLLVEDRDGGRGRVWLFALWPAAVFLGLIYSDSVFIAAAAACIFYARAGHLARASIAGSLACAVRPFGLALVALMLAELLARPVWRTWRAIWIVLIPLPMLGFAAFLGLWTGDWLAYFHAQSGSMFDNSLAPPWQGAWRAWIAWHNPARAADVRAIYAIALFSGIAGAGLVALAWTRTWFPRSLAAYCTVAIALALSLSTWRSTMRYELALFPLLLLVPASRRWYPPLIIACIGGFAYSAFHLAQGYWLG